jgi:hypothetical protein
MRDRRSSHGFWAGCLLAGGLVLGCAAEPGPEPGVETAENGGASATDGPPFPPPPTEVTSALANVPEGLPPGAQVENSNFDLVSWLTFVALNWPADTGTCSADTRKTILSSEGPVVWETYLSNADIFVMAPSSQPLPWCPQSASALATRVAAYPAAIQELVEATGVSRVFGQISKAHSSNQQVEGIAEVGGPLTDQNGRFARYEIRTNEDEYNYLVGEGLWNKKGQVGKTIEFPQGATDYGPVGAIELKAAWKVLGKGDDPTKFYTIRAIVFNDAKGSPSPGENPVTLGLVGLHILHKTKTQSNWLWSTFEQKDNLTSFSNPGCSTQDCPPNQQTAVTPFTELDAAGNPINKPTQVTRVNPIENEATEMNTAFQKLLAGSVWENYSLVASQWTGNLGGLPKPAFMANTVIETYTQGPTPAADAPVNYPDQGYNPFIAGSSSSCMKCHSVAQTAVGTDADFSFLLGGAK